MYFWWWREDNMKKSPAVTAGHAFARAAHARPNPQRSPCIFPKLPYLQLSDTRGLSSPTSLRKMNAYHSSKTWIQWSIMQLTTGKGVREHDYQCLQNQHFVVRHAARSGTRYIRSLWFLMISPRGFQGRCNKSVSCTPFSNTPISLLTSSLREVYSYRQTLQSKKLQEISCSS